MSNHRLVSEPVLFCSPSLEDLMDVDSKEKYMAENYGSLILRNDSPYTFTTSQSPDLPDPCIGVGSWMQQSSSHEGFEALFGQQECVNSTLSYSDRRSSSTESNVDDVFFPTVLWNSAPFGIETSYSTGPLQVEELPRWHCEQCE